MNSSIVVKWQQPNQRIFTFQSVNNYQSTIFEIKRYGRAVCPKNNFYKTYFKFWQSWLRQQNCYSSLYIKKAEQAVEKQLQYNLFQKMAELAAPTKLLFAFIYIKRQSRLSKNNCNTIYFKKMAELAAPTKLLYNMCVLHIISHFFGGI